jgi:hypothetical protein
VALKSLVMLAVLAAAVIVARPAEAKSAGAKRNIVVPVTVMVNLSSRTIRPSDDEVVERVRQASDLWMRVSAGRVSLELVQIIELKTRELKCDGYEAVKLGGQLNRKRKKGEKTLVVALRSEADKDRLGPRLCPFAGVADTGGEHAWVEMTERASTDALAIAHELGHTLGLGHSQARAHESALRCDVFAVRCADESLAEYGGVDLMGGMMLRDQVLNPIMLRQIKLLAAAELATVSLPVARASRVALADAGSTKGVRAVRVLDGMREYWLSYLNRPDMAPQVLVHTPVKGGVIELDAYPLESSIGLAVGASYSLSRGIITVLPAPSGVIIEVTPKVKAQLAVDVKGFRNVEIKVKPGVLKPGTAWSLELQGVANNIKAGLRTIAQPIAHDATVVSAAPEFRETTRAVLFATAATGERVAVAVSEPFLPMLDVSMIPPLDFVRNLEEGRVEVSWIETDFTIEVGYTDGRVCLGSKSNRYCQDETLFWRLNWWESNGTVAKSLHIYFPMSLYQDDATSHGVINLFLKNKQGAFEFLLVKWGNASCISGTVCIDLGFRMSLK